MSLWRSGAYLGAVRKLPCCFPGCNRPAPSQPCHSNQIRDGKGMGIKAHDFRVAAGCDEHHRWNDQAPIATSFDQWEQAYRKTIGLLFLAGLITVRSR